jgi:molecular chaperone IbpA
VIVTSRLADFSGNFGPLVRGFFLVSAISSCSSDRLSSRSCRTTTRKSPATCSIRASPRELRTYLPARRLYAGQGCKPRNGLLHIDLVREIPDAMKPRAIPIAGSSKVLEVQSTKCAA